jgi:Tol biopolymer transport system component
VVLISPLGGPDLILTEHYFSFFDVTGPYLSWSPDGRALTTVEQKDTDTCPALTLYVVETGEKYPLTKKITIGVDYPRDSCPAFSPDGRILAFCRYADWNISDLYLLDLSHDLKPAGEPRRLTFQNFSISGVVWASDGSALIYSAGLYDFPPGGNLWRIAISGSGQPQKLASLGQDAYFPTVSHRASRLAYTHRTGDNNIWRIAIPSPKGKTNPPMKFIASTRNDGWAQYSPDGQKIAFESDRSGSGEVWICDADGSNAIQLTRSGNGSGSARWSPDSSRLAFQSIIEGQNGVDVINASGGNPKRLTSSFDSVGPAWSRDGHWIYFMKSGDGSWKVPAEGGPVVPVGDCCYPNESADGRFIYLVGNFNDLDHRTISRIPVGGGDSEKLLDSLSDPLYAIVDDGIYFLSRPDPARGYSIRFVELAARKIQTVAELGKVPCGSLSVSPDRRWALYTQTDQSGSDLMLVENFR